jgi:hypothetical protein
MRTQRILALGFDQHTGKIEDADLKTVDEWLDQGWTVKSIDAMGTGPLVVVLDAPTEDGVRPS